MAVATVIHEGGLKRGFDPRDLRQVDVACQLPLVQRLEIEFLDIVSVCHDNPGFLGMGGIDEHRLCHDILARDRPGPRPGGAPLRDGGAVMSRCVLIAIAKGRRAADRGLTPARLTVSAPPALHCVCLRPRRACRSAHFCPMSGRFRGGPGARTAPAVRVTCFSPVAQCRLAQSGDAEKLFSTGTDPVQTH